VSPLFNKLKGPAGGTALSRLLGAGRDIVISRFLGANGSSDAFWVAFTIPTIFRRFVADEGLTGAMIPALTAAEKEEGIQAAQRLTRKIAAALILANTLLIALGLAFTPQLVRLFANDFAADPAKFALTVEMTRWLLPFLVLVSFVSLFEGLLNFRDTSLSPN
jgi:putative peptidoglycan lipid II flippase